MTYIPLFQDILNFCLRKQLHRSCLLDQPHRFTDEAIEDEGVRWWQSPPLTQTFPAGPVAFPLGWENATMYSDHETPFEIDYLPLLRAVTSTSPTFLREDSTKDYWP